MRGKKGIAETCERCELNDDLSEVAELEIPGPRCGGKMWETIPQRSVCRQEAIENERRDKREERREKRQERKRVRERERKKQKKEEEKKKEKEKEKRMEEVREDLVGSCRMSVRRRDSSHCSGVVVCYLK